MAADRRRGRRLRMLATSVAGVGARPTRRAHHDRRVGHGAGGHERVLLRGDRAGSARHRRRDRVRGTGGARGRGCALGPQRRGAAAGGRGCGRAGRCATCRCAGRLRVRCRQRRAVRRLRAAGTPRQPPARARWHRRARGRDDRGRAGGHTARRRLGGTRRARPCRAAGRDRCRHLLLGDPLCVRSTGHAPHVPCDLQPARVAAAGDGDGHWHRRARPGAHGRRSRRCRTCHRRGGGAPRRRWWRSRAAAVAWSGRGPDARGGAFSSPADGRPAASGARR